MGKQRGRDGCGTALALEAAGERWGLLVMRELMFGPRRFNQLLHALPGLSGKVLAERLERLEAAGIIGRRKLPPPASIGVYELTPWGRESDWLLLELGRWGMQSPGYALAPPLSAASLMLSLRATYDPARAGGLSMVAGFWIGDDGFVVLISGPTITVQRAEPEGCDAVLESPDALRVAEIVHGGADLSTIRVRGSSAMAARFVTLFPLPKRARPAFGLAP